VTMDCDLMVQVGAAALSAGSGSPTFLSTFQSSFHCSSSKLLQVFAGGTFGAPASANALDLGGWELWGVGGTDPLAHRPTVVALNPAGPDVK
jgi:hypothetical protein